uniref:hypothetical protein n=1 Tax=Kocuria rhizophila TaxID=72000 RepID=UPI001C93037F
QGEGGVGGDGVQAGVDGLEGEGGVDEVKVVGMGEEGGGVVEDAGGVDGEGDEEGEDVGEVRDVI